VCTGIFAIAEGRNRLSGVGESCRGLCCVDGEVVARYDFP